MGNHRKQNEQQTYPGGMPIEQNQHIHRHLDGGPHRLHNMYHICMIYHFVIIKANLLFPITAAWHQFLDPNQIATVICDLFLTIGSGPGKIAPDPDFNRTAETSLLFRKSIAPMMTNKAGGPDGDKC